MESQMFDIVKLEKEKAIARFNCFRRIAKLWQFFEVLVVLGLISWSSARVPAVFRSAVGCLLDLSTYLFNHHVVFLIGNAIIVLLFLLCRRSDAVSLSGGGDLYTDYVKHSDSAAAAAAAVADESETTDPPAADAATAEGGDEEKQIVMIGAEEAAAIPQCEDVAAAIEAARRQIRRFQRTQSEKVERGKPQPKLRRSESQSRRNSVSWVDAEEMERLSNEEFRRTVDAFIDKHWCKKKKQSVFDEYDKYQLLKMA